MQKWLGSMAYEGRPKPKCPSLLINDQAEKLLAE
jgi:hypothetical protein